MFANVEGFVFELVKAKQSNAAVNRKLPWYCTYKFNHLQIVVPPPATGAKGIAVCFQLVWRSVRECVRASVLPEDKLYISTQIYYNLVVVNEYIYFNSVLLYTQLKYCNSNEVINYFNNHIL